MYNFFHFIGTSLLKRLIHNHPQYEPIKENTNYIVKLKLNYRSHPQIIHLPNDLFYKGELVVCKWYFD